ncbi:2-oxoglutarate dehydrogenase complex dihydrolipoyllysine-residue succinyltransferase [Ferrovibrio terrae]|uniref:Dihydrolipoyllysine-residue succinyltransferase component of 2-oxoglutarate dehydrogenase complex n=1 Tax=Ferrovibrio terrae TaxID=2594003 RepID=A0A516GXD3_9PROT|nr:2-oxoglutarate dehydrogenase complex dihydrolipoyllysine-residue succinyltransferase [Ferrovibrio terrae]QDO96176.1 2-oxoglutarate dehydrogenase complex dihydrolipoyllysine-residue succinyltransferase [Ferrovibrio terrae]
MAVEIRVPQLAESISEATVGKWSVKAGDSVARDQLLVELETDKVTVEVNAQEAGTLDEVLAAEGATVQVGDLLATLTPGAGAAKPAAKPAAAPAAAAPAPAAKPAAAPAAAAPAAGQALPAAAKLAAEKNVNVSGVAGSGKDGRVTKGDVMDLLASGGGAAPAARPSAPAGPRSNADREERQRMSKLRQVIARRLKEAQNTAALLTTFNEVDMTALMAARKQYVDQFEKKHGVRLGFMSFFVKACVQALREFPAVNAEIEGDEIVFKNYFNIGCAVSTPTGLVVPVIRDADHLSFAGIEKTISDLGKRARDGKLGIDELQGGSFSITNGGVFGSLMSTPIINPPQSAILGMHKIQDRPMAINGQVVIRPMMYIALTYDHRIVDGREAVSFLVRVKECLEDPQRLLFEM